ncbi:MAG: MFS transporter [Acidimicrobiia bacterium]
MRAALVERSSAWRIGFGFLLTATMGVGTFALVVFGVLAGSLIDEFGIARWQLGALVTATSLVGAILSPTVGRLTDRLGGRGALLATLGSGGLALAAIAGAPSFVALVAAAALAGIAHAGINPSTNKLIAEQVAAGRRGLITGIKQSGVQMGTFLGGLLLPAGAVAWGWRGAVVAWVTIPVLFGVAAVALLPPDRPDPAPGDGAGPVRQAPVVWFLVAYGFLLGLGGSAVFTYLPLYAQEALGLDQSTGGRLAAAAAATAIVARIAWVRVAEPGSRFVTVLITIAGLAAVTGGLLAAVPEVGAWSLWPAALLAGVSVSAWNSVGMLAVIAGVPSTGAGRASGLVLFGFLTGLGTGAPIFGWSVDRLGSYRPGWSAVTVVFLAALAVAVWWSRRSRLS